MIHGGLGCITVGFIVFSIASDQIQSSTSEIYSLAIFCELIFAQEQLVTGNRAETKRLSSMMAA